MQAGWEEDPAGQGATAAGKGRLQRECPRDRDWRRDFSLAGAS